MTALVLSRLVLEHLLFVHAFLIHDAVSMEDGRGVLFSMPAVLRHSIPSTELFDKYVTCRRTTC